MKKTIWIMYAASIVLWGGIATGATLTIEDLYTDTTSTDSIRVQDNYSEKDGAYGAWNDGHRYSDTLTVELHGDTDTDADISFAGIWFDLSSSLPAGAIVTAASLELYCTNAYSRLSNPREVVAYPFLEHWEYGTFCWARRYRAGGTDYYWNANSSMLNLTPGTDLSADPNTYDFAANDGTTPLGVTATCSTDGTAFFDVTNIVKLWATGAMPNNGFALVCEQEGLEIKFASINNPDPLKRPKLTITYTDPQPVYVDKSTISVTASSSNRDPADTTVTITNNETGPVTLTITPDTGMDYIGLNKASVTIASGGTDTFTINWYALGLTDGAHGGNITLSGAAQGDIAIPTTLNVADGVGTQIVTNPVSLSVREQDTAGSDLAISLGAQPKPGDTVLVEITSINAALTPAPTYSPPAPYSFDSSNWDTPQTITFTELTGDSDTTDDVGNIILDSTTASAVNLSANVVPLTVVDNDPEFVITPGTTASVTEGSSVTINVAAASQLFGSETVTVNVSLGSINNAALTISQPSSGTFTLTAANWSTGYSVVIAAGEDDADEVNGSGILTITDAGGFAATKTVTINEIDNDALNITVDNGSITVLEADTAGVPVQLNLSQPASGTLDLTAFDDVRISLTDDDSAATTTLTAIPVDGVNPVTVYVFAVADADSASEISTIQVTESSGLTVANSPMSITVNVTDKDIVDYDITPDPAQTITATIGDTVGQTISIMLTNPPTGTETVSVSIQSGNLEFVVSGTGNAGPVTLDYTSATYLQTQDVIIRATGTTPGTGQIRITGLTSGVADVTIDVNIITTYSISGQITIASGWSVYDSITANVYQDQDGDGDPTDDDPIVASATLNADGTYTITGVPSSTANVYYILYEATYYDIFESDGVTPAQYTAPGSTFSLTADVTGADLTGLVGQGKVTTGGGGGSGCSLKWDARSPISGGLLALAVLAVLFFGGRTVLYRRA